MARLIMLLALLLNGAALQSLAGCAKQAWAPVVAPPMVPQPSFETAPGPAANTTPLHGGRQ